MSNYAITIKNTFSSSVVNPDPHQRDKMDLDSHQNDTLDPDPHKFADDKPKCKGNKPI